MELKAINNIYFIGIGGIGMSALARYFVAQGKNVAGYDKTSTQLTKELEAFNIPIVFSETEDAIPKSHLNATNTLVVITPAVPKEHKQLLYFQNNAFNIKKRAVVLGEITKDTFCFAVAGTHGKTTTSSILAHLLHSSGVEVTSFLGGIVEGYNTNLIGNGTEVTVVEADEFDRSFLHLHPNLSCITSMDADHLDIYGDAKTIEESFVAFANKTPAKSLFVAKGLPVEANTVAVNGLGDFEANNIKIENGYYVFTIKTPNEVIENVSFSLPGHHNISNALMAFAMAKTYGVATDKLIQALASFPGIRRRFSFKVRTSNKVYIDDYAHHPTEVNAVFQAVEELFPNQKKVVYFQPHLFSRTRDFMNEFAASLSQFDKVRLLEIYPARELPIEGVSSAVLLDLIKCKDKKIIELNEIVNSVVNEDYPIVITLGAGDIGEKVSQIQTQINEKLALV